MNEQGFPSLAERGTRVNRWLLTVVVPAALGVASAVWVVRWTQRSPSSASHAPARPAPAAGRLVAAAAGGAAGGIGAPRFSIASERATVQLDPTAPDYDPLRLMSLANLSDIFAAEPRNPSWAPKVEGWLGDQVKSDVERLVPGARELTVECRTTICKLHWRCQVRACAAVRDVINGLYAGAAGSTTKPNEVLLVYGGGKFFTDVIGRADPLLGAARGEETAGAGDAAEWRGPPQLLREHPSPRVDFSMNGGPR